MSERPTAIGALDGVVVIDFTQMLSGPFAAMMLADQGARVIKIEPPQGDQTRKFGPFRAGQLRIEEGGYGGYFASTNRNKESLVVDLKSPAGRDVVRRLVARADIVIENFRAGVMERLGLGYEQLREINPRLVYGCIRGFGDERTGKSPYGEWPAYDVVSQAMGGIMGITSTEPGGQPTKIGPGVGDIVPAMQCAFGLVTALFRARATGEGQFVDVAMVDGVLALCERIVFQHSIEGTVPGPEGNSHPLLCPYGLFPAKDGWVAIGCPHDEFWRLLVRTIGMPQLADDPRYRTTPDRLARRTEVEGAVSAWTSVRTKAEIAAVLGTKIPFGPVLRADEIFADEHTRARGMLAEVDLPGVPDHPVTIAGTPIKMTVTPGGVRHRAPLTGEHTARILADFGYSEAEIGTLTSDGGACARGAEKPSRA
ncbi:MAG: CoA transferase [Hyphomicrobiaceae bacterium]|nr:CoA transferase [Hyphomicrobiaceae bacterium]